MKISVITGASSGIGREFALMLDKIEDCEEIWVIARRENRLRELSETLRAKVRPIELDLSLESSFEEYKKMLDIADKIRCR